MVINVNAFVGAWT